MNTRSDTDEGKARPSVWPVYMAAAVIGILGLFFLGTGVMATVDAILIALRRGSFPLLGAPLIALILGGFGSLTACGLVRLHVWGWWCGVVWACLFAGHVGWLVFIGAIATGAGYIPDWSVLLWLVPLLILVVWPLAARRRLFFLQERSV